MLFLFSKDISLTLYRLSLRIHPHMWSHFYMHTFKVKWSDYLLLTTLSSVIFLLPYYYSSFMILFALLSYCFDNCFLSSYYRNVSMTSYSSLVIHNDSLTAFCSLYYCNASMTALLFPYYYNTTITAFCSLIKTMLLWLLLAQVLSHCFYDRSYSLIITILLWLLFCSLISAMVLWALFAPLLTQCFYDGFYFLIIAMLLWPFFAP